MPKKNDLNAIKLTPKNTLKDTKKKPGRKAKEASEKENKTIALKFTEARYREIQDMAGTMPLATFLKIKLDEFL